MHEELIKRNDELIKEGTRLIKINTKLSDENFLIEMRIEIKTKQFKELKDKLCRIEGMLDMLSTNPTIFTVENCKPFILHTKFCYCFVKCDCEIYKGSAEYIEKLKNKK